MTKATQANKKATAAVTTDIDAELAKIETVSGKIRYLSSTGMKTGDIARKLEKRYQHVRNVLTQPLKKTAE